MRTIQIMSETPIFQPYQSRRAFQEIAQEIQRAILAKKLKAGERLPSERSLAEQFQVGRLTIREALRTLEAKGIINIRLGRGGGSYVGMPDPTVIPSMIMDNLQLEGLTAEQITEARAGLECSIVEYAVKHANKKDLERIEKNIEESREIIDPENASDVVSKMIDYHILLGEATHNLPLTMFIRALMEWARRRMEYWIPTVEQQSYSYKAHKAIFESIKKKDVRLAKKRMKDHVVRISGYVTRNIK